MVRYRMPEREVDTGIVRIPNGAQHGDAARSNIQGAAAISRKAPQRRRGGRGQGSTWRGSRGNQRGLRWGGLNVGFGFDRRRRIVSNIG